jgi:hypothetical protein
MRRVVARRIFLAALVLITALVVFAGDRADLATANRGAAGGPRAQLVSRLAMLLLAGTLVVREAAAGDTHAGFNVKVHVSGSAHSANIAKSAALPSGMSAVNQLRFGMTTGAGYFVRFKIEDPAVEFVDIHGLGPDMRIVSGAKDVFVPSSAEGQVVTYTVKVRPGAELSIAPPVRATFLP